MTIHEGFNGGNVDLQVPAGSALSLKVTNGSIQAQGIVGEMDLESTNGGITLDQVGGSILAHSLNGGLSATVVRLDSQKPSSFSTFNGRIDLTLPVDLHANLNMRSDHRRPLPRSRIRFQTSGERLRRLAEIGVRGNDQAETG